MPRKRSFKGNYTKDKEIGFGLIPCMFCTEYVENCLLLQPFQKPPRDNQFTRHRFTDFRISDSLYLSELVYYRLWAILLIKVETFRKPCPRKVENL